MPARAHTGLSAFAAYKDRFAQSHRRFCWLANGMLSVVTYCHIAMKAGHRRGLLAENRYYVRVRHRFVPGHCHLKSRIHMSHATCAQNALSFVVGLIQSTSMSVNSRKGLDEPASFVFWST